MSSTQPTRAVSRPEEWVSTVETVASILRKKGSTVWSLTPEATVYEAVALMAEKGVGALAVVAEGKLAGIVSERDYARKVILKGKSSKETRVGEIMTAEVVTVEPCRTVADCMRTMTAAHIRHLPVVEKGELVGMVSIGDMVNAIMQAQAETIQQLRNYVTGQG